MTIDDIFIPDLPDGLFGEALVSQLDTAIPLTLFPVRLATRFHRVRPGAKPKELWVRIFPDIIHADGHNPELTAEEIVIGKTYWEQLWRAGNNADARERAHQWAVSMLGAPRTAWVAQILTPLNQNDAPHRPVPPDQPLNPAPQFENITPSTDPRATLARLLPDRWYVIMRRTIEYVTRVWSAPVQANLSMAPNLVNLEDTKDVRELLKKQNLWWMVDFDEAVAAGMGVRIPWDATIKDPVSELLVIGVRDGKSKTTDEMNQLLQAHRFTEGLEFIPQGTPTNNTETVKAGFKETPDNLEAYFRRQSNQKPVRRPNLKPASRLGNLSAANATSIAMGLLDKNAFDFTQHGGNRYGKWQQYMNRVLWPATIGYYIDYLLTTDNKKIINDARFNWLQTWIHRWVKAVGFLPAFRIGSQPYGILPVARRPTSSSELGDSARDELLSVLYTVDEWENSVSEVANFNHYDSEPKLNPEEEAERIAGVLGAVPHPAAFRLRQANYDYNAIADDWSSQITELESLLQKAPSSLLNEYNASYKDSIENDSVREQQSTLFLLRWSAVVLSYSQLDNDDKQACLDVQEHVDTMLIASTEAHQIRSEMRQWDSVFSGANLPTASDPKLWYITYGEDGAAEDGSFPSLKLVPDAQDLSDTIEQYRNYAEDARKVNSLPRKFYLEHVEAPLLDKLIQRSINVVRSTDGEPLAKGIEGLVSILEDEKTEDPLAEIRRLLRETLGLATYRYDAWVTSFANERLAQLRANSPSGLQVGAYGWVVNLEPEHEGKADSSGFIHAPTLDHAATAAIMRSAWTAYANDAKDAPFAVDLSSDRVRRGTWLLEAVRNGAELGELLGTRFERRLHDSGLSQYIADLRELALDAAGHSSRPANGIIDGLAIANAYSDSMQGDVLYLSIENFRSQLQPTHNHKLLDALLDTVADLDSTADLLIAQSVHSASKGNLAEAAATLSVSGSGDAGIPQLRMPQLNRSSQIINHRIVAVFPENVSAPQTTSLLAVLEPSLLVWLQKVLPNLDEITVRVLFGENADEGQWETTLGSVGLNALEVAAMAAVDGDIAHGQLAALLIARARYDTNMPEKTVAKLVDTENGVVTFSSLATVLGVVRNAVWSARALRGSDLSNTTEDEVNISELELRRASLIESVSLLAVQPPEESLLLTRFAQLAAIDIVGLIKALSSPDERIGILTQMLEKARRISENVLQTFPDDYDKRSPLAKSEYLCDLMRNSLSLKVPVLALYTLVNRDDLVSSFEQTASRLDSPTRALAWHLEVGRVHQGAGRCYEMLDLLESTNLDIQTPYQIAQLPNVPGEPWVAVRAPIQSGSRLHLFAVNDAVTALHRNTVSGLLFDSWSEPIPDSKTTTDLAIHFDKPGAQPPQAVLLAMPPDEGQWTTEHLETILLQTLQLAKIRAVGPETLSRWGHAIPAIFLSENIEVTTIDNNEVTT